MLRWVESKKVHLSIINYSFNYLAMTGQYWYHIVKLIGTITIDIIWLDKYAAIIRLEPEKPGYLPHTGKVKKGISNNPQKYLKTYKP